MSKCQQLFIKEAMKYSIITAVRNGKKFIQRLMGSVFSQSYPHTEWIVQDGGSTDGTLDILRPHMHRINLVSEADTGIYDAWNKAVARASGDWAIFLGADDFFVHPHSLAQCHRHLRTLNADIDLAFGALVLGRDGKIERLLNRTLFRAYNGFLSDMGVPFPASFIRVPILQKEKFDASYKIAGDYEWVARVLTGKNLVRLPVIVSYMEMGGISDNGGLPLLEERKRILYSQVAPKARMLVEASARHLMDHDDRLEKVPE